MGRELPVRKVLSLHLIPATSQSFTYRNKRRQALRLSLNGLVLLVEEFSLGLEYG